MCGKSWEGDVSGARGQGTESGIMKCWSVTWGLGCGELKGEGDVLCKWAFRIIKKYSKIKPEATSGENLHQGKKEKLDKSIRYW